MSKIKRALSLLIAVFLLATLTGCVDTEAPASSSSTWDGENDMQAYELYKSATAAAYSAKDVVLHYTVDRQRLIGTQTFTEKVEGNMTVKNMRRDDMIAVVSERLLFGTLETAYKEIYCDGRTYVQVNDSEFELQADADAYLSRQYPLALINADYYNGFYAEEDGSGNTLVHFIEPVAMESWLRRDARVQMQSAAGTAVIDSAGRLTETTYRITYLCGEATYSEVITMQVSTPKELDIGGVHPEHFKDCPVLENADALKLLLRAVGDVYTATSIKCDVQEIIDSTAVPVRYEKTGAFLLTGAGDQFYAKVDQQSSVTDYRYVPVITKQLLLFENGVFTAYLNGNPMKVDEPATAQTMRSYIEDAVLAAVFNPDHIKSVQLEIRDNHYYLTFRGNETFMKDMMTMVGQFLQMDLDAASQSSETLMASGYLELDRNTGLPVGMGIDLVRKHTLNSITYDLQYILHQTVNLLSVE